MSFQRIRNLYSKGVFRSGILMLVLWFGIATLGFAQGDASIQGTVSDSSGGTIQGAAIQVKNLETGAVRNLLTDETGRFDAASLPVGRYVVKAEKAGFRGEEKTGISLVLGQREILDVVLQVGDARQTVQVESSPTVVMITTEDDSGLVGEKQVKDLPLNGRSYDQLIMLNPGVVNYTSQRAGGIGTSCSLRGVVHDTRVEHYELIITAAIQRKVLHLLLTDKTRIVFRRDHDDCR